MSRGYIVHMLQDVESIAEHSHRVAVIAFVLACEAGADPFRTMAMAVFHDLPETRTGDANWHQKQYVHHEEEKAFEAQLALMGKSAKKVKELLTDYKQRESLESKIAKDADIMDYLLSLKELELQGNREATQRLTSEPAHLYTDVAKELYAELLESLPNEWYQADRNKTSESYKV